MSKDNFPNFCSIPFLSMYLKEDISDNSSARPCCEYRGKFLSKPITNIDDYWNTQDYQNLRDAFNNRIMPKQCEVCINDENNGIRSKRMDFNDDYFKQAQYFFENKTVICPPPLYYDIRPSNYCNLECTMCNPYNSSAIDERYRKYEDKSFFLADDIYNGTHDDGWVDYLENNAQYIKKICYAGGEPLLMPQVIENINWLVDNGYSKNIDIKFLTNATVFRSKWVELFPKFNRVEFNLSIDGVGDTIEYVRYPSKWTVVEKNLKFFKTLNDEYDNIDVKIIPSIQLLNFVGFHKLVKLSKDLGFKMDVTPVYHSQDRDYLYFTRLPNDIRQHEVELIKKELVDYDSFQHNLNDELLDSLANSKFNLGNDHNLFPQMVKYWDSYNPVKFLQQYPYLDYLLKDSNSYKK